MNGEAKDGTDEIPPSGEFGAYSVLAYLLAGPLTYGGIGYLLDLWLGTGFLLPVGIVGGMTLALYLVYVRYGTP